MKVTSAKQLSAYLKDARCLQKQSQGKVADKVGIRQDTVSSFELNPESTKLGTGFRPVSCLRYFREIALTSVSISDPF
ncbi:transcriptional regulator [Aeromonas salmonicida]|uniref:transcriptional regulator n=1 Tax=Aeromonas salmonicida TaxID=645 RepID=UPI000B591C7B|nr:transcriptional regulator [Aeromonas salmonicida]QYH28384.1 transcriptional regulator [Aeromonas salmonicida subsp. masoucida]QYH32701.1 transcriptional regulator [Aeromonas salmonicida subsp. masoucida]